MSITIQRNGGPTTRSTAASPRCPSTAWTALTPCTRWPRPSGSSSTATASGSSTASTRRCSTGILGALPADPSRRADQLGHRGRRHGVPVDRRGHPPDGLRGADADADRAGHREHLALRQRPVRLRAHPQQAQDLSLDPLFARQTTLTPNLNAVDPLSASLVKSISGIDVYQSNTNTIDTTTVSGLSIHHGCMFGPSSIGRAPAGPCRAAYSSDDNYGETAKVIWLAYEGEALLDNRFIVNIHTN